MRDCYRWTAWRVKLWIFNLQDNGLATAIEAPYD